MQLLIKENKKKHNKIVLLVKNKLTTIEVLTSKALFDSNISHVEFDLVTMLIEFNNLKKANKNSKVI